MAKKVLTYSQAEQLRARYIDQKELLLQKDVDQLGVRLFEMVFDKYLKKIQTSGGRIISTRDNLNLVRGLDGIFKIFNEKFNVPVVNKFVTDAQGLTAINTKYFDAIQPKATNAAARQAIKVVNKGLGIGERGAPIKGGFVDKFIRDPQLLNKIKKQTVKAITNGKGFQEFRNELKETIQGNPGQALSGGLQQYYRNYAYDTLHKVDRVNQDEFAQNLGLKYFYYSGGIIKTTRELCRKCNGKIINAAIWGKLKYSNLAEKMRDGVPNPWNPLEDLGGYGCRHRKNYISEALAKKFKKDWLNFDLILN